MIIFSPRTKRRRHPLKRGGRTKGYPLTTIDTYMIVNMAPSTVPVLATNMPNRISDMGLPTAEPKILKFRNKSDKFDVGNYMARSGYLGPAANSLYSRIAVCQPRHLSLGT